MSSTVLFLRKNRCNLSDSMFFRGTVAKNLKASRVSHQWAVPTHESMQSSHLLNDAFAGLQVEVIGIGNNGLASDLSKILNR
jgi:hypothetical protein